MAKDTSILLCQYLENQINDPIAPGKHTSESEGMRTLLLVFEQEERQTNVLAKDLKVGENCRRIKDFDRRKNLEQLHARFQKSRQDS